MSYQVILRPGELIAFRPANRQFKRSHSFTRSNTRSPGELSVNAARKMRKAIRWMAAAATEKTVYEKRYKAVVPWRVNMLTLTFKENLTDDNLARRCVSSWIDMAKYRFELNNYVWKAEPQERGAIHFHMVTDTYVPYKELQYTWNRELHKNKLSNITDNSTDVHAILNVDNLEAYLINYLVQGEKHEGRRKIVGKLWSCSHKLSQAGKSYVFLDDDEMKATRSELWKHSILKSYQDKNVVPPEWCKYIDMWRVSDKWFKDNAWNEYGQLYADEIKKLQPKRSLELWPRKEQ